MCRTMSMKNIFPKKKKGKKTQRETTFTSFFLFGSLLVLHHTCGMRINEKLKEETQRQIKLCSTGYVISIFFLASSRVIPEGATMSA